MTKGSFIELLSTMSKEDIDRLIREKGKPRKPIKMFIHLTEEDIPRKQVDSHKINMA